MIDQANSIVGTESSQQFHEISFHEYIYRSLVGQEEICFMLRELRQFHKVFEESEFLDKLINDPKFNDARVTLSILLLSCDDEFLCPEAMVRHKAHEMNGELMALSGLLFEADVKNEITERLNFILSRCHDFFVLRPERRFFLRSVGIDSNG